ncbi:hypothetical protein PsYK624_082870 [Phanerochaete sordida]|uniref:Uncharacterized protein n=1 Tax=Phanerochaete sordida TaxID=48140 RepID=A0A9P3GE84_9APHY|nr:hypothetical protein PsYK624_082870 [Phanerochaete sordida]
MFTIRDVLLVVSDISRTHRLRNPAPGYERAEAGTHLGPSRLVMNPSRARRSRTSGIAAAMGERSWASRSYQLR